MTEDIISNDYIKSLIESIDFNPLITRMLKVHHWPNAEVMEGLKQYKNFLFLKRKYGKHYSLPPSVDIDEFWHNHILHTKRYVQDCMAVFGEYLHHHPHHGENGEISNKNLSELFEKETQFLYQQEFGTYIHEIKPAWYKILLRNFVVKIKTFFQRRFNFISLEGGLS